MNQTLATIILETHYRYYLYLLIFLVCSIPFSQAQAADFTFVFLDGPGEGVNDTTPTTPVGNNPGTTLGEQRRNIMERAGLIWGSAITSPVAIRVQVDFAPLTCDSGSAVLGSAGPDFVIRDFPGAPQSNTWYHSALADALRGLDLDPGSADIGITINSSIDNNNACLSNVNWYLGFDSNKGNDIDLLVVLLHEIAHGLGFSGFTDLTTGQFLLSLPDVYSLNTFDNTQGITWSSMNNAQRLASVTNTNEVVWNGLGVAASTGDLIAGVDSNSRPRLYAPASVEQGSSIYHFDTSVSPNEIMEPFINDSLSDDLGLTIQQMFDLGWQKAIADISLSSVGPMETNAVGEEFEIMATVSNIGTDPAGDVTLNFDLPNELAPVSISGCESNTQSLLDCDLGPIDTGTEQSVTLRLVANAVTSDPIEVSVTSSTTDLTVGNDANTLVADLCDDSVNNPCGNTTIVPALPLAAMGLLALLLIGFEVRSQQQRR